MILTDDILKERNPWRQFLEEKDLKLWGEGQCYALDRECLSQHRSQLDQSKKANKDQYQYHLELPPCPWDGNPLKANVFFLTLNPGYVEQLNHLLTKLILRDNTLAAEVLDFRRRTLLMEASLRPEEVHNKESLSCFEAVEMLDDYYWSRKFQHLIDDFTKDGQHTTQDFRDRVCVLQYVPYSSEKYQRFPKEVELPSQQFIRELLSYRLSAAPMAGSVRPVLVVMRARDEWTRLFEDMPCDPSLNLVYRQQVTMHKGDKEIVQDPRGQFITPKAFQKGMQDWQLILDALKCDE